MGDPVRRNAPFPLLSSLAPVVYWTTASTCLAGLADDRVPQAKYCAFADCTPPDADHQAEVDRLIRPEQVLGDGSGCCCRAVDARGQAGDCDVAALDPSQYVVILVDRILAGGKFECVASSLTSAAAVSSRTFQLTGLPRNPSNRCLCWFCQHVSRLCKLVQSA